MAYAERGSRSSLSAVRSPLRCGYGRKRIRAWPSSETPPTTSSPEWFRRQAIDSLKKAAEQGYHATGLLKIDPDLDGVRNEADFQNLIHDLEQQEKLAGNKPKS